MQPIQSGGTNKKWFNGLIQPISLFNNKGVLKQLTPNFFMTMDIETIDFNGNQIPIAISSCGYSMKKDKMESKLFLINDHLLFNNKDEAIKQLWLNYFNYLEKFVLDNSYNKLDRKLTIFAHNLGEFDGYFLYQGLMMCQTPDYISSLIDESNSFISITHSLHPKFSIIWKDSLRLFPISLDKLCKMFGVEGKLTTYNPKFSNINLFSNPKLFYSFKKYSLQDAISLYNALRIAQFLYFDKYNVDLTSVYSTATLSLKIFRSKFQNESIYILPYNMDNFIRQGYYGGGTDVYKAYGKKIYYYDVNSLYPHAMLNAMPHNLIQPSIINLSNRTLDSFFGFAEASIECPLDMARPVLPFHKDGKTIYPVGNWIGTYFSEELKAVEKLGYKITLIRGYEFTKFYPFNKYVNTFFEQKRISKGVEKSMAKLQLNTLYGYFGRKLTGITTMNVNNKDLENVLLTRIVKSITPINDNYTTVLTYSNINNKLLDKLNNEFHHNIGSEQSFVMSNVAIAAAVTSYARMLMIPFKIDPNTLYTDTDSIFTTVKLDPSLIGSNLGQMKDELDGLVIEEAYFIGPKKYGYYLIDQEGNRKEFSVFSGVPRNSLSFQEVRDIYNGKVVTKNVSNRFFKSINTLNIIFS